MNNKRLILCAAAYLMSSGFGLAAPAGKAASVSAKTVVPLVTTTRLKSGDQKVGEQLTFRCITDVKSADGVTVIAAGALAHGAVTKSEGAAGFGKIGKLEFTCDYVEATDGTHVIFLDPEMKQRGAGSQTAAIWTTPIILLPFQKGKNVELAEGTPFSMLVSTDTKVVGAEPSSSERIVVNVLEKGKKKSPFSAVVKLATTDSIVFTSAGVDKSIALKDIESVQLTNLDHKTAKL